MEKSIFEKGWYKEYVQNRVIPDYIEGADLSQIEWKILGAQELYNFISENYICEVDNEQIFLGNVDETKFNDHDNAPLGMKYLPYSNPNERDCYEPLGMQYFPFSHPDNADCTYLIGTANNKVGKKTIVAALTYENESKSIYYDQKLPVTKISVAEANSFLEHPTIYQKMFDVFVDVANKEQPIVMIKMDKSINEDMYEEDCRVFEILKQTAEAKGFPSSIFSVDSENAMELRKLLCSDEKASSKH